MRQLKIGGTNSIIGLGNDLTAFQILVLSQYEKLK
jgi:hypothetical protein